MSGTDSSRTAFTEARGAVVLDALVWILLGGAALLVALPLAFMVTASFKPAPEIMRMPYRWLPIPFRPENYAVAIAGNDGSYIYLRNVLNSLIVSASIMTTTVILSSLAGYGLAKFKFRGRTVVFMLIMATMMIPFETIMIPLYLVTLKLGMQDSYRGLIVPFMMNAFGVFLMRQYLLTFPEEMLDAARIDGAGEPRIFRGIVFPNCAPAIASLAILTFRQQWDNLLWPLLVAQRESMKTIPAYIVRFAAEKHADEGAMMAVAVIASLPVFVLFFTLSNYFVGGSAAYSAGKE